MPNSAPAKAGADQPQAQQQSARRQPQAGAQQTAGRQHQHDAQSGAGGRTSR